jgi:hypothetical protein
MKIVALSMVLGWFLLGCSTTSSEKELGPDRKGVGVSGYSDDEIRKSLVSFFSDQGYELSDSNRRTLDFDRPASKWAAMRYGSFVNPETFVRMKIIIMEVGPIDHWIGYDPLIVTERGTSFERREPLKGQSIKEMQSMLETWEGQFASN